MRFDYRGDAPLDFECASFMPQATLRRHRDIYMGNEAAALAVYTDGDGSTADARTLYKMSMYSLPQYKRRYFDGIKREAGGYFAHKMFFGSLSSSAHLGEKARRELCRSFGSVEQFRYIFTQSAGEKKSPGFLWLAKERGGRDKLKIVFTEENRLLPSQMREILCLDLWEHSYCETYGSDRVAYAAAFLTCADFSRLEN